MSDREKEIRERWAAASPGPWRASRTRRYLVLDDDDLAVLEALDGCSNRTANFTALIDAPDDVAWLLGELERLARGRDEALADLESAWAKAGEMLDSDAGMEAYTAADAMRGIIEAARNEGEAERDRLRAVVEAATAFVRNPGRGKFGLVSAIALLRGVTPEQIYDAALDAATGKEASDGEV